MRLRLLAVFWIAGLLDACDAIAQARRQGDLVTEQIPPSFENFVGDQLFPGAASSLLRKTKDRDAVAGNERRSLQTEDGEEDDSAGSFRLPSASVQQTRCVLESECLLEKEQVDRYLDSASRVWVVNDAVLDEVRNDLQLIVNCTREDDVILFDVEEIIQPLFGVVLRRRLTLSAYVEDPQLVDGVFPLAPNKTKITCPRKNEGVFLMSSSSVTLANLVFEGCNLDSSEVPRGVVEVEKCEDRGRGGAVHLHHVIFKKNKLVGSAGLRLNAPSCSAVDAIDVSFVQNTCGGECGCGLTLSMDNRLKDCTFRGNKMSARADGLPFMMRAGNGSHTVGEGIGAWKNELGLLHLSDGSFSLSHSMISQNSLKRKRKKLRQAHGVAIHIENSEASIQNCTFSENRGVNGSVLHAVQSVVSVSRSAFDRNQAQRGGVLYVKDASVVRIKDCVLRRNRATSGGALFFAHAVRGFLTSCLLERNLAVANGGGIFMARQSELIGEGLIIAGNAAKESGGGLYSQDSSIELTEAALKNNDASHGGAVFLNNYSKASLTDCSFQSNKATKAGGGICMTGKSELAGEGLAIVHNNAGNDGGGIFSEYLCAMNLTDSTLRNNTAGYGGALLLYASSKAYVTGCQFHSNRAERLGGGICMFDESELIGEGVTIVSNSAEDFGGGLYCQNSNTTLTESTLQQNNAKHGGAVLLFAFSKASVTRCSFQSNEALNLGGGICMFSGSELIGEGLFIAGNAAKDSGGGLYSQRSSIELTEAALKNNNASRGGALSLNFDSRASIADCSFQSNKATKAGGGICMLGKSELAGRGLAIVDNTAGNDGGGIVSEYLCTANLTDSTLRNNTAEYGGALLLYASSKAYVTGCNFQSNRATSLGGGICMFNGSQLIGKDVTIAGNNAGDFGGGLRTWGTSTVKLTDSILGANRAYRGGALSLDSTSSGVMDGVIFKNNSAVDAGGACYVTGSTLKISNANMTGSTATSGGICMVSNSNLIISEMHLTESQVTSHGGFIAAEQGSSLRIRDVKMTSGMSLNGGAISLDNSTLNARNLWISQCAAEVYGGAIAAMSSSRVLCINCTLQDNEARRGGAVSLESSSSQQLAGQLDRSVIRRNTASYGGGLHVVNSNFDSSCANLEGECVLVALTGTDFAGNIAEHAGGAIFSTSLSAIRVSCSPFVTIEHSRFYTREEQASVGILRGEVDTCPSWMKNFAGDYGASIATYASRISVGSDYEGRKNEATVNGNHYVLETQRGRSVLSTISLKAVDELGQGPAIGVANDLIRARVVYPNGLITGSMDVDLINGVGQMSAPAIRHSGNYVLHIVVSEANIDPFDITLHARKCMIGETRTADGAHCQQCNAATFTFNSEDEQGCLPCPKNGNCESSVIRPVGGYWHQTPCSSNIQRCLATEACDFETREDKLTNETNGIKHLENCDLDEASVKRYMDLQCKEGHEGPLCGSCAASYVKAYSSVCQKCFTGFINVILVMLALAMLFGLSSILIKSNLKFARINRRRRQSAGSSSGSPFIPRYPAASGRTVAAEYAVHGDSTTTNLEQLQAVDEELSAKTEELAKWEAIELFKITVNFMQVTATALFIKVKWPAGMLALFYGTEFISGITAEAVNLSMSCLLPEGVPLEKSIIVALTDVVVPFAAVVVFSVFWFAVKLRSEVNTTSLVKRILLSAIAVFYVGYISLTKTLVNILNCVEVHDSLEIKGDTVAEYWAMDTGVRCFTGSHAALAFAAGWPLLLVITVGFPSAIGTMAVMGVGEHYNEGWIYDICGFMYRSYRKEFLYWESVIMLRKASLAVVVSFSYPLGANLQQALAVFVLILALYAQLNYNPYRYDFGNLNTLESLSILVSLLTVVFSVFFGNESVSEWVQDSISCLLTVCNISVFVFLFASLIKRVVKYLRIAGRRGARFDL